MNTILELSKRINVNAHNKGFWDKGLELEKKLLLIVSETTEAMEVDRTDNYCTDAMYTSVDSAHNKDELADVAIRVFDLAYEMNIDLEKHMLMKMRYNESRPYKHGKKY